MFPQRKNAPTRPTWGRLWRSGLFVEREVPAIRLHKPRVVALALDVAEYGGIKGRVWRFAARARPIALLRHQLNHLFGGQRFLGFAEHLGSGVDSAEILVPGFAGGLLGSGNFSGGGRLLRFRFPRRSLLGRRFFRGHVCVPS